MNRQVGILNTSGAICPYCNWILDMSSRPEEGLGFKPGSSEAVIFHPDLSTYGRKCPYNGRKLLIHLPESKTEIIG